MQFQRSFLNCHSHSDLNTTSTCGKTVINDGCWRQTSSCLLFSGNAKHASCDRSKAGLTRAAIHVHSTLIACRGGKEVHSSPPRLPGARGSIHSSPKHGNSSASLAQKMARRGHLSFANRTPALRYYVIRPCLRAYFYSP